MFHAQVTWSSNFSLIWKERSDPWIIQWLHKEEKTCSSCKMISLSSCHQGFTVWVPYGWCHLFCIPAPSFFLANCQLSCKFTLKEFKVYGRLSDLPTQYQMSGHPLRVLIGFTFCWVDENYVTFDSVVIMEYFIDDHCHLQKETKKEQLKGSQIFLGRKKSLY